MRPNFIIVKCASYYRYSQGSGNIWLDDIRCMSTHVILAVCLHGGFGVHNCDHSEDVAVSCSLSKHTLLATTYCKEKFM